MPPDRTVTPDALRHAVILIVDDEETNVRLLARILGRAGFSQVHTTSDPREVVGLHERLSPDLILLDVRMPGMDGFAVLDALRERVPPTEYLPILAITGDDSPETRQSVLVAGAKDFLGKPFQPSEVVVRVENLLTTRMLHRSLRQQNESLEQTVHERTAELELALVAAQSASRAKSQFLATMSHELRTPLNAVIGFSQQLLRNKAGNLQPQDLAYLERIRENGARLLAMISDILELARIQTGDVQVELSDVSLEAVVRRVLDDARPSFTEKVAVRAAVPGSLQPIRTDEPKLRRVLLSLVQNAAKFTARGGIVVGIAAGAQGRPIRVDVVDTGIGIEPDRLRAVFGAFEQADNTAQRQFGGTGLGLALSHTLCSLLGYRLTAVSEPGAGSSFSVALDPAAPSPTSYREIAAAYGDAAPATH